MTTIDLQLQLQRPGFRLEARFEVPARGVTALYGPSGAGKTSLLRAIAGLERATGQLTVSGHCWQDGTHFLPVHERHVGYVFQEPSLFRHLNVRGNLEYGLARVPANELRMSLAEVTGLLGLTHLLDRSSSELSGGERQRVAIGRALLASPRLLLMDEPLASLDAHHKRELLPFLETLHQELELPVIYVSHAADEVARLVDHLVLMDKGRTIDHGPIGAMLTRLDLPIAFEDDAAAVIDAAAESFDAADGLSRLRFGGGELLVPGQVANTGRRARVRVLARDVSLTLEHQTGTSILNIVPAVVMEIAAHDSPQCLVRLDSGGTALLARITRRSANVLDLKPGKRVYAQIKTVALLE